MNIAAGSPHYITHCTYCECDATTEKVTCWKEGKYEFLRARKIICENCTDLPTFLTCPYCEKPGNQSVRIQAGNPIDIGDEAPECISCHCSIKGEAACHFYNYTVCDTNDSCNFFVSDQIEQTSCYRGCIDPTSGLMRPEGDWITKKGVSCSCSRSVVSCSAFSLMESFIFHVGCAACTPEKYEENYNEKGR